MDILSDYATDIYDGLWRSKRNESCVTWCSIVRRRRIVIVIRIRDMGIVIIEIIWVTGRDVFGVVIIGISGQGNARSWVVLI